MVGTLSVGLDYPNASCLGNTPLGPKDAGGPGLLADTGAFPDSFCWAHDRTDSPEARLDLKVMRG
jgi:hypothetical protein